MAYELKWAEGTKEMLQTAFPKMKPAEERERFIKMLIDHVTQSVTLYPEDAAAQPGQSVSGGLDIAGFHVRYKIDLYERVALIEEVLPRHAEGITSHAPFRNLVGEELAWLTPRARQVLVLARKEADRLNHAFIGTEHLLLGMVSLGQGTAVTVLGKMGVELETLRHKMEEQIAPGPEQKTIGNIPYTPRCMKVLHLAANAAIAMRHSYLGTEHILLGLLMERNRVAARMLGAAGVDLYKTTREILAELHLENRSPEEVSTTLDKLTMQYVNALQESAASFTQPKQFTPRAQQVLRLAHEEAVRFQHDHVGPEHLLLGLLRLGQGVPWNALRRKGIDLELVRRKIAETIAPGSKREILGSFPYSAEMKKVLAHAAQAATALSHSYVGTEHLFLGILGDESGITGSILKDLGVDKQSMRQEILRELNPNG